MKKKTPDFESTVVLNNWDDNSFTGADDIIVLPNPADNNMYGVDGHGDTFTIDLNQRAGATTSIWSTGSSDTITIGTFDDLINAKPPVEINFNLDPLSIVLLLRSKDMEDYQIHEALLERGNSYTADEVAPFLNEAYEIREHFKVKLVTNALKGIQPTPFRKDMGLVVTGEKYNVKLIPILIRMPDFYKEDKIVEDLVTQMSPSYRNLDAHSPKFTETLDFVTKYTRLRRSHKIHRYVFKDADNHMYVVSVTTDNSIAGVFDYVCNKEKRLTISGNRAYNKLLGYDFGYYEVTKVQIESE